MDLSSEKIFNIPEINNIIMNYKYQMEHYEKFKHVLNEIKRTKYFYYHTISENTFSNKKIARYYCKSCGNMESSIISYYSFYNLYNYKLQYNTYNRLDIRRDSYIYSLYDFVHTSIHFEHLSFFNKHIHCNCFF